MNLEPSYQTKLYGLENEFREFVRLFKIDKLPNKILLSGDKGIGKCTLAYHLINFILSRNEENRYNIDEFRINSDNYSYKLIQNGSNPNFYLIDIETDKKVIDISKIRNLIISLNKSSLNSNPRFVLIDNIEFLNLNSINALLKILEEPNDNIYFILIHNNKKIVPTLLSRCLNFKIALSHKKITEINQKLFNKTSNDLMNKDLINYYTTPGKLYGLLKFSEENEIDISDMDLKDLLSIMINESYYKKDNNNKALLYDLVEFFLLKKISVFHSELSSYFLKKINNNKKFNLDDETLFLEINSKLLNG